MLLTEYDYDTDIAVQRQEAYEDGAQQNAIETAKNMLTFGDSIEKISQVTGLSIDFIKTLNWNPLISSIIYIFFAEFCR